MTAAVPLIHAANVAMVTGIMVKQTGESEGSVEERVEGEKCGNGQQDKLKQDVYMLKREH